MSVSGWGGVRARWGGGGEGGVVVEGVVVEGVVVAYQHEDTDDRTQHTRMHQLHRMLITAASMSAEVELSYDHVYTVCMNFTK